MLMKASKDDIFSALRRVVAPDGQDIVSAGMVDGLQVNKAGEVMFLLKVDPAKARQMEPLRQMAESVVMGLPGVRKVVAILTSEKQSSPQAEHGPAIHMGGRKGPQPLKSMPAARHIIAVASGKGGVGKSTVAVNLALALRRMGLSVGLMDADIYGPSIPRMLGIKNQKPGVKNEKLQTLSTYGIRVMSMGFLVEEESPMIWRGPMVQSAIRQFLEDVEWSDHGAPLDILVVDMPPGTGDVQLTLAQKVPLTGAVIVSTPQDIALIDARKGLEMFRRTNVPVLGIVENMSYFCCPHCGGRSEIFSHGGAREEAEKMGVPFLGEIPLHAMIRTLSDAGTPVVAVKPESDEAKPYLEMAARIGEDLRQKIAA